MLYRKNRSNERTTSHLRQSAVKRVGRQIGSSPLCLIAMVLFSAVAYADNWPAWRGARGGISQERKLPTEWTPEHHILWKTPIPGRGLSSPIVWGNRVFITTARKKSKDEGAGPRSRLSGWSREVICLDRDSGKILWQTSCYFGPGNKVDSANSLATPTPATDGRYIAASFGNVLVGLDTAGQMLWSVREEHYDKYIRYGASSSPLIFRDFVIHAWIAEHPMGHGPEIAVDAETGMEFWSLDEPPYAQHSHLTAFDLETGEAAWSVRPENAFNAYSSPALQEIGGRASLLLATMKRMHAYAASDGSLIYSTPIPSVQPIMTIVSDGKHAYTAGEGEKWMTAVHLDESLPQDGQRIRWIAKRGVPGISSPLIHDGLLYMITRGGIASSLDADTGERMWIERIGGQHLGSPVLGDGKIYFTSGDGVTTVIRTGREFALVSKSSIGEGVSSSIAISDGKIFIRGADHLYCIGTE